METGIIQEILSWPAIIQGALGSALFSLIIIIGGYITKLSLSRIKKHKNDMLSIDEILKDAIQTQDITYMKFYFLGTIYASLHYIIKAFLFLVIGFFLNDFIPVFGFIGYLGGFIYLLLALNHLPDLDTKLEKYDKDKK